MTWDEVKDKYLEYVELDEYHENMKNRIDFGYWLLNKQKEYLKNLSYDELVAYILEE